MSAKYNAYQEYFDLKNGERALIRPIQPSDAPFLEQAFHESSRQSLHNRFMDSRSGLSPGDLKLFTDFDPQHRFALAAGLLENDEIVRGLGVGRWMRDAEGNTKALSAEFAVIVVDEYQRQGLGRRLIELLIDSAKEQGLERLYGTLWAYNTAIQKLLKSLGPARFRQLGNGEMEVVLHLSEF